MATISTSSPLVLEGDNFFCRFAPNSLRIHAHHRSPLPRPQSRKFSSTTTRSTVLRVSAEFRTVLRRRRRNSLRDKLIPSCEDKVSTISESLSPDIGFLEERSNLVGERLDFVPVESEGVVDGDVRVESSSAVERKSDLWNRLEGWVDQYKVDSEFWGVGTGPVFIINQDDEGKIVRVEVNDNEIIKRHKVGAFSLQLKSEGKEDEFESADSKISRAKLIARMIESGEYALPRNSSVVKFVSGRKKMPSVEGIPRVSFTPKIFLRTFPKMWLPLLCGFCVGWIVIKFFVRSEKVELSREEAEMLRRKVKLRMEREKLEESKVEVLETEPNLPLVVRPELDRNELAKSIVQARSSGENLVVMDSLIQENDKDVDFYNKVKEIREMVRKVHQSEQMDTSEAEATLGAERNNIHSISLETDVTHGESGYDITSEITSPKEQEDNIKVCDVTDNMEACEKKNTGVLENVSHGEILNMKGKDTPNMKNFDELKTDELKDLSGSVHFQNPLENGLYGNDNINPSLNNQMDKENIQEVELQPTNVKELSPRKLSNGSGSRRVSRNKPKIIKSVQEAKEYLAGKCSNLSIKDESDLLTQVQEVPPDGTAQKLTSDKKDKESKVRSDNGKVSKHVNVLQESEGTELGVELLSNKNGIPVPEKQKAVDMSIPIMNQGSLDNNMLSLSLNKSEVPTDKIVGFSNFPCGHKIGTPECANGAANFSDSIIVNSNKTLMDQSVDITSIENTSVTSETKCNNVEKEAAYHNEFSCAKTSDTSYDSMPNASFVVGSNPSKIDETCEVKESGDLTDQRQHVDQKDKEFHFALQDNTYYHDSTRNKDTIVNFPSDASSGSNMVASSQPVHTDNASLNSVPFSQSPAKEQNVDYDVDQSAPVIDNKAAESNAQQSVDISNDCSEAQDMDDVHGAGANSSLAPNMADSHTSQKKHKAKKSQVEVNFDELEPVIKKIGDGFKDNYLIAKGKVQQQSDLSTDISKLGLTEGDEELEWMNDENLRKVVFQVRENELTGKDPFHLMSAEEKNTFYKGLETKAEKVNKKLLRLHEWVHSRIENLDYGADGISLYDPPEKVIPRWKGPSVDEDPDFLNRQRPLSSAEEVEGDFLQRSESLSNSGSTPSQSSIERREKRVDDSSGRGPKTLVECSDGSVRPGEKKGKEHWQHTKKWSQGFLEVYNAETDPETKSIMRDMGSDLDRWFTEKDKQDVADLLNKISKRKRRYIEKKMEKIKREVETFGAPAVITKYKEYSDDKEEDYLWWLDLPYLLCLELYTIDDGTPRVGFYTLEMAADLELNPKQYHVIAFEDPGDSKNFCHIIQAHMDMLGAGKAFVVARPPKDTFRESKANGFNVTVIRKGEVKFNIDETLEEVEEKLAEIGSKMYHDKIMRERSVDIGTLMKGMVTAERATTGRSTKRKTKRKLNKPSKS